MGELKNYDCDVCEESESVDIRIDDWSHRKDVCMNCGYVHEGAADPFEIDENEEIGKIIQLEKGMKHLEIRSDRVYDNIACSCQRIAKYVGTYVYKTAVARVDDKEIDCVCEYDVYRCVECGKKHQERHNEEVCEWCKNQHPAFFRLLDRIYKN